VFILSVAQTADQFDSGAPRDLGDYNIEARPSWKNGFGIVKADFHTGANRQVKTARLLQSAARCYQRGARVAADARRTHPGPRFD